MRTELQPLRYLRGWVIGLFVLLLAGAVYFYMERVLFLDASYILFRIVNQGVLQIQEYRYGSFITQGVPLLATKMGLPLRWIVVLYSASFNIFYLAVAALLVFRYRNYALAVLMGFYYILFVSDTYYWTNNEVHQGIAWLFLFFAFVLHAGEERRSPWLVVPVFLVLAFFSVYTHPLVLFPALFLWLFFLLRPGHWPFSRWMTILLSCLLVAVCVSKFLVSMNTGHYDSDKMHAATHLSFKGLLQAFVSPMAKKIVKHTLYNYWLVPVIFFAGIYGAWRQKKHLPVLLTIGFSLAYFLAICLTFTEFIPFYTESEWMPLTIIAAAPFVYDVLPLLKRRQAVVLIALIFLVRLTYIGFSAEKFVARKNWNLQTLQAMRKQQVSKGIVYENDSNRKILIMNWGSPVESIIASALAGDQPNRTFVVGTPENIGARMPGSNNQIISCFESWDYSQLNTKYFSFDVGGGYRKIGYEP